MLITTHLLRLEMTQTSSVSSYVVEIIYLYHFEVKKEREVGEILQIIYRAIDIGVAVAILR